MESVRRILISGYYGFSNLGDEAVLSSVVAGIRLVFGDRVEITALSANPEETERVHGIKALPRMSLSDIGQAMRECDVFVSGGGSLIQDATSLRSLAYYLELIRRATSCGCKVMVLGQGIGPLDRWISRIATRWILNKVDSISVRDEQSAELLKSIGVTRPPVVVTADPTFLLKPISCGETERLLGELSIQPTDKVIALSMRSWPSLPHVEDLTVKAIQALQSRLSAKLLLVAMHFPEDLELAKRIASRVEGVIVQPKWWCAEELLGVLSRCDLVVSMRLHTLIFAASMGTPSLGIAYDPKVEAFLASAGQECISLKGVESGALTGRILEAWEKRAELASTLAERRPAMEDAAAQNFRMLIELVEGGESGLGAGD